MRVTYHMQVQGFVQFCMVPSIIDDLRTYRAIITYMHDSALTGEVGLQLICNCCLYVESQETRGFVSEDRKSGG